MNKKTIIVVLLIAVAVILAIIFWPKSSSAPQGELGGGAASGANYIGASLGGQVYGAVNPDVAGAVPETNPFKAEVNPYKDAYQNPFAQ
jgi:hypothetical protein